MCGIAGFWDTTLTIAEKERTLAAMLETIGHRGPDYRGVRHYGDLSFGHNRLSIIDLLPEANQPMEKGGRAIIYNGEVYNFVEIREELKQKGYIFKTHSDTEVILASYEEWGEACVTRFIGMWAFAIWDPGEQKLFCSRDRFGIKPFYYIVKGGKLYFASEIKALKAAGVFDSALNTGQVGRFIQLGWVGYDEETMFACVRQLAPAHNLIWKGQSLQTSRYWDISPEAAEVPAFGTAKAEFGELFFDSVRIHMRSDVKVGSSLSGGIDSSAIASVVGNIAPNVPLNTFTIYYSRHQRMDERAFAQSVIEKYPSLKPHFFEPSPADLQAAFGHFAWVQDVPIAGSSYFSQYFLMKLAKEEGVKVLLDGQGSDEYLMGYLHGFYRLVASKLPSPGALRILADHIRLESYPVKEALNRFLKSLSAWVMDEQQLMALEYRHRLPFVMEDASVPFQLEHKAGNKVFNFLYHGIAHSILPNLLHYQDRNSMAFSIESRVPFLDHRLVEYAFSLPSGYKVKEGVTKYILRESLKDILPLKVYARRDKKGFVTPGETDWLRGPLRALLETSFPAGTGVNEKKASRILQDYRKGQDAHAQLVWRLVQFNYWLGQL
ncbi:MAG: asparagine synthase (glutamine-hydrolyzing) [Saprospiraceae bacterium]